MQFKEVEQAVVKNAQEYSEKYNVTIDRDFAVLKLMEEVRELAEAILTYEQKSRPDKLVPAKEAKHQLALELADVVGMAMITADLLEVDLLAALQKKWIK